MRGRLPLLAILFAALATLPAAPLAAAGNPLIQVEHRVVVLEDLTERAVVNVTYDTTHYSEKWTWSIPRDAETVSVHDRYGSIPFTRSAANPGSISFATHYDSPSRRTGEETFTIAFTRPSLEAVAVPFYRGGQSTVGEENFRTTFTLQLHPSLKLARSDPALAPGAAVGTWETQTTLPKFIRYIVEAPKAAGIADFTVGPWRFLASESLKPDLARVAQEAFPYVQRFPALTGFPSPYSQYLVAVEPGDAFTWEIGRAIGNGIIVLNRDAFVKAIEEERHLSARQGLIHETFHAATTDALDWTRGLSWWKEGTAEHAEYLAEIDNPKEASGCALTATASTCYMNSSRITLDALTAFYQSGQSFPFSTWDPSRDTSDSARRLGYGYSGFVVSAYVHRYGDAAYRNVWLDLANVDREQQALCDGCDADAILLESLRRHAGNVTVEEVLYPYRDTYLRDPAAFKTLVAPLVAPPMPTPPARSGDGDPVGSLLEPGGLRVDAPDAAAAALAGLAAAGVVAARRRWR